MLLWLPVLLLSAAPCPLAAGEQKVILNVHGVEREALVVVGARAAANPPVLFAWHGFGGSPERLVGAVEPADRWADAVVVFPRGLPRTFPQFGDVEGAGFQVTQAEFGGRDLAFFDALYDHLLSRGCLDRSRVYSTGFSNGAFFSNLLACHRGARLAAIAPVGGAGPFEACERARVHVRVSHGTRDKIVPFSRAEETVETWAVQNHCKSAPRPAAEGCAVETCEGGVAVMFCSANVEHTWGGKAQAAAVAAFLRGHVLAEAVTPRPRGQGGIAQ